MQRCRKSSPKPAGKLFVPEHVNAIQLNHHAGRCYCCRYAHRLAVSWRSRPTAVDLGAATIRSLLEKTALCSRTDRRSDLGQVLTAGSGQIRTAIGAQAGLSHDTPAVTCRHQHGMWFGLKAVHQPYRRSVAVMHR